MIDQAVELPSKGKIPMAPVVQPWDTLLRRDPYTTLQKLRATVRFTTACLLRPFDVLGEYILSVGDVYPVGYEQYLQKERRKYLELECFGSREVLDLFRGKVSKEDATDAEVPKRKLAILALAGGQAGSNGAAILLGMQDVGAFDRADGIFAVSAGIPTQMYMRAGPGMGDYGAEIYRKDNVKGHNFLNLPHGKLARAIALRKAMVKGPQSPIMNTPFIAECMKTRRPISLEELRKCPTELYALVMNADTAEAELIDIRTVGDPIAVMSGGICVPGVSSVPWVEVDGKRYIDAAYVEPIPLERVFDMGYTDVLVVANNNFVEAGGPLAELQQMMMTQIAKGENYGYNKKVIDLIRRHNKILKQSYDELWKIIKQQDPKRRIAFITPTLDSLRSPIENDGDKITEAFWTARDYSKGLFSSPH